MTTRSVSVETVLRDSPSYSAVPVALAPSEKTAAVTRLRYLEGQLLDESGHPRRGIGRVTAEQLVARVNDLRHALGWLEIEPSGQWRWPACTAQNPLSRPEAGEPVPTGASA
jgi:hypothetical protein